MSFCKLTKRWKSLFKWIIFGNITGHYTKHSMQKVHAICSIGDHSLRYLVFTFECPWTTYFHIHRKREDRCFQSASMKYNFPPNILWYFPIGTSNLQLHFTFHSIWQGYLWTELYLNSSAVTSSSIHHQNTK